jgi:glycosyltransferase involved in cell wall biosynthesis
MKISVIITAYNYARFLHKCLDSVLNQTAPPHEVIVVDDGSTDGTQDIVKSFKDICYLRQENSGKAIAFNRGFRQSSGDIVCHLDADDYWHSSKIEQITKNFKQHCIVGGVTHDADYVDEEGKLLTIDSNLNDSDLNRSITSLTFEEFLCGCFVHLLPSKRPFKGTGVGNTISVMREAVEDLFPLPRELGLAVDGALISGAARYGLICLPEKLSAYRHHNGNNYLCGEDGRIGDLRLYKWLLDSEQFSGIRSRRLDMLITSLICQEIAHRTIRGEGSSMHGFAASVKLLSSLISIRVNPHWKYVFWPMLCLAKGRLFSKA